MRVGFWWESLMPKHSAILCEVREVTAISKSVAAFPRLCDGRGLSHAKPFTVVIRVALHKD
jgi:DNA-binding sugar fermentation-stimulating protein